MLGMYYPTMLGMYTTYPPRVHRHTGQHRRTHRTGQHREDSLTALTHRVTELTFRDARVSVTQEFPS